MAEFDDIPEIALSWLKTGRQVALATVVETWGSAPRPVGSQLAIGGNGEIEGSVSGGCVEGAVVIEAQDSLADGRPRLLEFGVSDDTAFAAGLACGGTIRVMVEPLGIGDGPDPALIKDLVEARAARRPVALVTNTESWARRLTPGAGDAPAPLIAARLAADRSGFEGREFVHVHNPPLKLFVTGAAHIAQALVPMARMAGYDVVVIDPRAAFATEARFPGTEIRHDWPDEVLAEIGLDARSAVVTLSHDPKIDDPAVIATLGSEAFYLGCLGSKKTHGKRLERLRAAGFDADSLARIHAPVGLDIGASSPAEIAVAILAEMTARLRRGAL